jgi:hypothetical protein
MHDESLWRSTKGLNMDVKCFECGLLVPPNLAACPHCLKAVPVAEFDQPRFELESKARKIRALKKREHIIGAGSLLLTIPIWHGLMTFSLQTNIPERYWAGR